MKLVKKEVKTFQTRLYCDCGGEMIGEYYVHNIDDRSSIAAHTNPTLIHTCKACGMQIKDIQIKYPLLTCEEI